MICVSSPVGVSRMPFGRFVVYTFLGSLSWYLAFAYAGKVLGKQRDTELKVYFHGADAIIAVTLAVLIALYVCNHISSKREYRTGEHTDG